MPDGSYRVRVALIHQGRTIDLPQPIRVDTRPPRPLVTDVEPHAGDGPAFLPQRGVRRGDDPPERDSRAAARAC